jgi:FkbM family methyltransferase
MNSLSFRRVEAIHPHWHGFLKLSNADDSVEHIGHASKGTYDVTDNLLTVRWEKYAPDIFLEIAGIYVERSLKDHLPRLEHLFALKLGEKVIAAKRISVVVPDTEYEVTLRLGTSDIPTFGQVFGSCEYQSPNLPNSADTIVDLGANIGLASVFFGLKYPDARLLAIEPEESNFIAMVDNTRALGGRVQRQHAAVWTEDGFISLHTESDAGLPLGAWGAQVSSRENASSTPTRCFQMGTLLNQAEFDHVDILKIDIEGAELEIFSQTAQLWLPRVQLIIVETHDRFRPGSELAVREALALMFEELPRCGENLFFRRVSI